MNNKERFLLLTSYLLINSVAYAADIKDPAQMPLDLQEGVAPNVLFTLDNSGSMAWGFIPDSMSGMHSIKAGRSYVYNKQYYNPKAKYIVPKKVDYKNGKIEVSDYPTPSFYNAPKDGFNPKERLDLSKNYLVSWGYDQWGPAKCLENCSDDYFSMEDGTKIYYNRAYYYEYSKSCDQTNINTHDSCYIFKEIPKEQEENFAIWYSFYRTRLLSSKTTAILSFAELESNIRLTWGAFYQCDIGSNSKSCFNNKLQEFSGKHRYNFFKWIEQVNWQGGTPSHAAVDRAGKLLQNPSSYVLDDKGRPSRCQSNYHIFMTDGVWNEWPQMSKLPEKGETLKHSKRLPDGTLFDPNSAYTRPYVEKNIGSLADMAFYYWSTPLLGNNGGHEVLPRINYVNDDPEAQYWDPRNDPATWLHMVNYTIGLGLSGSLKLKNAPTWDANAENPSYAHIDELLNLGTNGKNWPGIGNSWTENAYDIWHMAVNSRGEYFSIEDPQSLQGVFNKIFNIISTNNKITVSPAITSGSDDGNGYSYQALFYPNENWSGDLKAKAVSITNNTPLERELWSARQKLDHLSWGQRAAHVYFNKSDTLTKLDWSALSNTQQRQLNTAPHFGGTEDGLGQARLNFILGDRSQEGKAFRLRTSVLGDIVSSKPVVVRGARYLRSRGELLEPKAPSGSYASFIKQVEQRTPVVYVGANDGMLHGFNANTGEEIFAYVPSMLFSKLNQLTAKDYGMGKHFYYVDGSPQIADVYIKNQWRTVLVSSLGAGAKGLFALDITDPKRISLLWELDQDDLAKYKVGLGYGPVQPSIARLHSGQWGVVMGNGYAASTSLNGAASLIILDISSGAVVANLEVQGTAGIENGLSTPKLIDMNGNGVADFAYAGDLQGNIWRFDLNSAATDFTRQTGQESAEFAVAFGGRPLFTATDAKGNAQPITVAPTVTRHPSRLGLMVLFGTGRFYTENDRYGLPSQQSVYGIWDPSAYKPHATNKQDFPVQMYGRNKDLVQQHLSMNKNEQRLLTNNPVTWRTKNANSGWSSTGSMGWYLDLFNRKEMVVKEGQALGDVFYLQSMTLSENSCGSGIENWMYALDPSTGGRTKQQVWAIDGKAPDGSIISGVKIEGNGGFTIGQQSDGDYQLCTGAECLKIYMPSTSVGRKSWRLVYE
ncbi:PilC/PilY family type IV pilus protein [Pseudomonas sp. F1_0610]|uniref:pilus assembly protein n=1 Tax=Pseudomonas sp. F1_0610 TaxID=3114284 RepID=UPI0039C219E2